MSDMTLDCTPGEDFAHWRHHLGDCESCDAKKAAMHRAVDEGRLHDVAEIEGCAGSVHYFPVNDLVEHATETDECVCGSTSQPVERADGSVGWIVTHSGVALAQLLPLL
jgi:hypothetical protein